MKIAFFSLLIFTTAFISCSNKQNYKLLSPNNLASLFLTVNSDSGYNLKTPNGAIIKIYPNSFDVTSNTQVKIEIKEAYSMQDILLAGLSTESDGKPLRSAGMLYFSAKSNSKDIKFLKPIEVTIPAKMYDSEMKLFIAEIKKDSSINWIDAKPIDTSAFVKNLSLGKSLFKRNCANCHKPFADFIGPQLAGARRRSPNYEWAYKFVNNSNAMVQQDPYARHLKSKFGSVMTQFNLPKRDIKAILDYCDNEGLLNSNKNSDSIPLNTFVTEHPCGYDTLYYAKPKDNIEISAIKENPIDTSSYGDTGLFTDGTVSNQANYDKKEEEFSKKGYKYVVPEEGVYKFNIEKSGWYNIDVLFDEPSATKVQLFTEIQMQEKADLTVYLCIPKRKILMEADRHKDNIYLFHYSDPNGFLPMILNDDAFIFATTSIRNKIYYGITKFTIRQQQTIKINVKESSREEILRAFKRNQLDSIKLDIEKQEMEIIEKPCDNYSQKANTISITSLK